MPLVHRLIKIVHTLYMRFLCANKYFELAYLLK